MKAGCGTQSFRPDLQCSWQILLHHDDRMMRVMDGLMEGLTGGRLGLPSAVLVSWACALHMIHERLPQLATNTVERLDGEHNVGGCLTELHSVADGLDRQGGSTGWS